MQYVKNNMKLLKRLKPFIYPRNLSFHCFSLFSPKPCDKFNNFIWLLLGSGYNWHYEILKFPLLAFSYQVSPVDDLRKKFCVFQYQELESTLFFPSFLTVITQTLHYTWPKTSIMFRVLWCFFVWIRKPHSVNVHKPRPKPVSPGESLVLYLQELWS